MYVTIPIVYYVCMYKVNKKVFLFWFTRVLFYVFFYLLFFLTTSPLRSGVYILQNPMVRGGYWEEMEKKGAGENFKKDEIKKKFHQKPYKTT